MKVAVTKKQHEAPSTIADDDFSVPVSLAAFQFQKKTLQNLLLTLQKDLLREISSTISNLFKHKLISLEIVLTRWNTKSLISLWHTMSLLMFTNLILATWKKGYG